MNYYDLFMSFQLLFPFNLEFTNVFNLLRILKFSQYFKIIYKFIAFRLRFYDFDKIFLRIYEFVMICLKILRLC